MITSAAAIISFISLAPFGPGGGLSWLRRGALVRAFVGSRRHRDRLSCLASHLHYKGTKYFHNYQIFTHFFSCFSLIFFASNIGGIYHSLPDNDSNDR